MEAWSEVKVLLVNQCYAPDEVATARYLRDLAEDLVKKGHSVRVVCADRSYDGKSRYCREEMIEGVWVDRLKSSGWVGGGLLGKAWRLLAFYLSLWFRVVKYRDVDAVVCLTTPPLLGVWGAVHSYLWGERLIQWVMDLNPDEMFVMGYVKEKSWVGQILLKLNQLSFNAADRVVVLDQSMKDRLKLRGVFEDKLKVISLWVQEEVKFDQPGRDRVRDAEGWKNKRVVMFAGNMSSCHPMKTVMEAAILLDQKKSDFLFVFVGEGGEKKKMEERVAEYQMTNVKFKPYQPRENLEAMLSAADWQLVVMGSEHIGIVHPCKIYNMLSIAQPIVYVGDEDSHIGEMLRELGEAVIRVGHGQTEALVEQLENKKIGGKSELWIEVMASYTAREKLHQWEKILTG
jgi:glycosyltransferase involved in cell wall biosynthesis